MIFLDVYIPRSELINLPVAHNLYQYLQIFYATKFYILLRWAVIFLIIAVIAGIFGFTGIAATSASIAKIIFYIFIVLFLIGLILGYTIFKGK